MSKIDHFTDLNTWRKAHQLFLDILADVEDYPKNRGADAVTKQILAASSSISANMAEGFGRSRKRFVNCLDIALGETNETENWLYKVRDADFVSQKEAMIRLKQVTEVRKMLLSLKSKIENNENAVREEEGVYELRVES